jgi:hypothetical protein
MTSSAPDTELIGLPGDILEHDRSLEPLREYSDIEDLVIVVADPEVFYELMGLVP